MPRAKPGDRVGFTNSLDYGAEYTQEQVEFMTAVERYKRERRRPFPTWAEVLAVAKGLGYEKGGGYVAKPASGTALNTGHALYSGLAAAWAFLEGTGSTSADSRGSRTLTLDAAVTWTTNGAGDAAVVSGSQVATPMALASSLALTNSTDWTIAFGLKLTTASDGMAFGGDTGGNHYLRLQSGTAAVLNASGTPYSFTGVTSFTTESNWVLAYEQAVGPHLYRDGSEVSGSPKSGVNGGVFTLTRLGNGFSGTSFAMVGLWSYVYVWSTRLLNSTEVSALHTDPYAMFGATPGAFPPFRSRRPGRAGPLLRR